jgi:hypothetical protein
LQELLDGNVHTDNKLLADSLMFLRHMVVWDAAILCFWKKWLWPYKLSIMEIRFSNSQSSMKMWPIIFGQLFATYIHKNKNDHMQPQSTCGLFLNSMPVNVRHIHHRKSRGC